MKSTITRVTAVVALSLGVGIVAPAAAFASGSPTSTVVHGAASTKGNSATMKAYVLAKRNIDLSFTAALVAARATLTTTLATATTSAQRTAAQAAFTTALAAARSARASALTRLGKPLVRNASATVMIALQGRAYGASMLAINQTFKSTVAAARTTYHAALKASTTSTARVTARTAFKLALKGAISARQASIASLGAAPTAP